MGLFKNDDREADFYFAPTEKKAHKGKKKDDSGKKNIKYDAPIAADEIPAIITKLEEQLADYNQKR